MCRRPHGDGGGVENLFKSLPSIFSLAVYFLCVPICEIAMRAQHELFWHLQTSSLSLRTDIFGVERITISISIHIGGFSKSDATFFSFSGLPLSLIQFRH